MLTRSVRTQIVAQVLGAEDATEADTKEVARQPGGELVLGRRDAWRHAYLQRASDAAESARPMRDWHLLGLAPQWLKLLTHMSRSGIFHSVKGQRLRRVLVSSHHDYVTTRRCSALARHEAVACGLCLDACGLTRRTCWRWRQSAQVHLGCEQN